MAVVFVNSTEACYDSLNGTEVSSTMTKPEAKDRTGASVPVIITVTAQNVESTGFFCYMSKKKLGNHPSPTFARNWEEKARVFCKGLTVIRSDQCPYIVDATDTAVATAAKAGVKSRRVVEMKTRRDVLRLLPSAYGIFGMVLDGQLLSYHYRLEKDLLPLLAREGGKKPPRRRGEPWLSGAFPDNTEGRIGPPPAAQGL